MRILLWATFGAGTHYWGPGTSAFRLFKNNKNKDIKITLLHGTDLQGNFPDVFDEQIQIGNIGKETLFESVKYLFQSYKWIQKNYHNYDVFYGLTAFYHTFLPAYFFKAKNKPTYIKISGVQGGFYNNGLISKISGFSKFRYKNANKIDGFVSISTDLTLLLKQGGVYDENICYIPNGVDTRRFYPVNNKIKQKLRKSLGVNDVFTLSYIGGLTKNKNVIEAVKAIHELIAQGIHIQFLIIGPDRSGGIIEEDITQYINKYNLDKSCIRIQHSDNPENYFQASDVFVLNSKLEGLSNSLLEAMSCGLPCIAFPASGTVDLIEDKVNGFLTDGSSTQIAERLTLLYKNKSMYSKMSNKARVKIENKFSVEYVLQRHLELFRSGMDGDISDSLNI